MNIVVYAKPSLLQFAGYNSCLEENVKWSDIEPLVLRDVCVIAKKV